MEMIRSGSTALGAVVEKGEPGIMMRQIRHVHVVVPDGLGGMHITYHHEMPLEDRIRIYHYLVFPAFASFELE